MPKPRSPDRDKAFEIYKQHGGNIDLVEIAQMLDLPPGTIRGWKNKDKWSDQLNGTFQSDTERSKQKRGAPVGNKNALGNAGGAPPGNKNAETHGLFAKYLPAETLELIKSIETRSPLDILWDQIMIQYAAIIRSQQIMYVVDKEEMIKELKRSYEKTMEKSTAKTNSNSDECEYEYEFQFAWDRQATFLKAQSRAMAELRSMIKQYEEFLKNDLATEEQRLRVDKLKLDIAKAKEDDPEQTEDDGFLEAMAGQVDEIWRE